MSEQSEFESMTNEELGEASGGCPYCTPYGMPMMAVPAIPAVPAVPAVPVVPYAATPYSSPYGAMPYAAPPYSSPYGGMPYSPYGLGTAI